MEWMCLRFSLVFDVLFLVVEDQQQLNYWKAGTLATELLP